MAHPGLRLPLPHSQCNLLADPNASTAFPIQTCNPAIVRRRIACPTDQPVFSTGNTSILLVAHILLQSIYASCMASLYLSIPPSHPGICSLWGQYLRYSHPFHSSYVGYHRLASLRCHPLRPSLRRRRFPIPISLTTKPPPMGAHLWLHEPCRGNNPTHLALLAAMV